MHFHIKICGVTDSDEACAIVDAGADAIGLNFYAPSKRSVSREQGCEIANSIRRRNPSVQLIGVFVNETSEKIVQTTSQVGLDGIQFHGDESPTLLNRVQKLLAATQPRNRQADSVAKSNPDRLPFFLRAIRTTPNSAGLSLPPAADVNPQAVEIQRLEDETNAWSQEGVAGMLIDAASPGEYGGTGKVVDWVALKRMERTAPLILAGGLTAENVAEAILVVRPSAVDVASGVESSPGHKDISQVRKFVAAAKLAFAEINRPAH